MSEQSEVKIIVNADNVNVDEKAERFLALVSAQQEKYPHLTIKAEISFS